MTVLAAVPLTSRFWDRPRWDDPRWVHKQVARLYGRFDEADGPGRVLFRVEYGSGTRPGVLLMQAPIPPRGFVGRRLVDGLRSKPIDAALDAVCDGLRLRFRVKLNAVKARSGRTGSGPGRRPVGYDEMDGWVRSRIPGLAVEVAMFDWPSLERVGDVPLRVVTVDGVGVVTDAEALRHAIRFGVGKAKAYGCGLVTVAPAG